MDKEEVLNLAKWARVELKDGEVESLSCEFDSILNYVGEVRSAKVSPLVSDSQGETLKNIMREDREPHESGLYTQKILEQAPAREGPYLKVKKIL